MLTQNEIDIIIKTLQPYKPKRIGLFVSVARNEETEKSDIDILYSFNTPISLFGLVDMQMALENNLKKGVDLVSENAIHPLLKEGILSDLKIIYG